MKQYFLFFFLLFIIEKLSGQPEIEISGIMRNVEKDTAFVFFDNDYKHMYSNPININNGKFNIHIRRPLPVLCRVFLQNSIIQNFYIDKPKIRLCWVVKSEFSDPTLLTKYWTTASFNVKGSEMNKIKRRWERRLEKYLKDSLNGGKDKYKHFLHKKITAHPCNRISAYILSNASILSISEVVLFYKLLNKSLYTTFEAYSVRELVRNMHLSQTGERLTVQEAWEKYSAT